MGSPINGHDAELMAAISQTRNLIFDLVGEFPESAKTIPGGQHDQEFGGAVSE